jgi:hypothetical protein
MGDISANEHNEILHFLCRYADLNGEAQLPFAGLCTRNRRRQRARRFSVAIGGSFTDTVSLLQSLRKRSPKSHRTVEAALQRMEIGAENCKG